MTAPRHLESPRLLFGLFLVLGACSEQSAVGGTRSALSEGASLLWGDDGELFDPKGRLMDWSYAGYQAGEAPLPELAPTLSVLDHGAVAGDGEDDTEAFTAALAAARAGDVVRVPAGVYELRARITVPSGVVLQGAGRDATIVEVPVSLTDVYGNPGLDRGGNSSYSFGRAFIEVKGRDEGAELAEVSAAAARGDTELAVSSTEGMRVGQWVHVDQTDVNGELIDRLHGDLQEGGDDNVGDEGMEHYARIVALGEGSIELERPLPVDVELAWSPRVRAFEPSVAQVGIEHLTIRFPETPYPGHFKERGYNAIELGGVFHSWVRDVRVVNGDYGVSVTSSHFVTVAGVVIDSTNERTGHHALNCGYGGDNLFIGFDVRIPFVHDLTVEWYTTGNVFTQGRGRNLSLDHHRAAPYSTLWTELHAGDGSDLWKSGGAGNRGPHSAAYSTLWNVRADNPLDFPAGDYGPRLTFVGFATAESEAPSELDWWFEPIAAEALRPSNLWLAMRERRLGSAPEPGEDAGTPLPVADGGTAEPGADGGAQPGAEEEEPAGPDEPEPAAPADSGRPAGGCALHTDGGSGSWTELLVVAGLLRRRRAARAPARRTPRTHG
jgi:hypothetical protein